jgi:membrane protease YdiL (CAAX protease family)
MTVWIKRHQIYSFFILAFAISWAIWIPVILFVSKDGEFHPLLYIGGYGPFLSAALVTWIAEGGHGLRQWLKRTFRWRIHILWYIACWFLLPIIGLGLFRFCLYLLLGGQPDFSEALPWWNYLIAVPIGALFMGGNEEPGWRGYALPKLSKHLNPVAASLVLAVPWVVWHLPMYLLSGGGGYPPIEWFLIYVGGLSIITTWLYFKSSMSVIPLMLFHQGTNHIANYFPMPTDVLPGLTDWVVLTAIAYWTTAIVLLVATKGRLGYSATAHG